MSCVKETFSSMVRSSMNESAMTKDIELVVSLVVLFLYVVLILLLGKYLWNEVLCSLVSITKKATSIWQILGLAVLFSLINL